MKEKRKKIDWGVEVSALYSVSSLRRISSVHLILKAWHGRLVCCVWKHLGALIPSRSHRCPAASTLTMNMSHGDISLGTTESHQHMNGSLENARRLAPSALSISILPEFSLLFGAFVMQLEGHGLFNGTLSWEKKEGKCQGRCQYLSVLYSFQGDERKII